MKKNTQISIDLELYEKLKKEPNYSFLINKLVDEHYNNPKIKYENFTLEELKKERQKILIMQDAEKKIQELENVAPN